MKKVLIAVAAVLVLIIGALIAVPAFINGNAYKSRIISLAESATGRSMVITGEVGLRILPSPALSVEGVRLSNAPDAAASEMLALDSLQVQVALLPLLRGKVEVRSVRLVEPVIELEILADGTANWEFVSDDDEPSASPAPATGPGGGAVLAANDNDDDGDSRIVSLERFEIVRGTLTFRDAASGIEETVENLSAVLSADSLSDGPFAGEGRMRVRGVPLRFDVSVGDASRPGAIPVNIDLRATDIDAKLAFRGSLSELTGDAGVAGRIDVKGEDLRAALQPIVESGLFTTSLPVPGAQSFSFRAAVEGTRNDLALNEIELKLGETRATGAISAVLNGDVSVDATLAVGRVDLDTWLDAVALSNGPAAQDEASGAGTAQPAAPAVQAVDDDDGFTAVPLDVAGSVSLTVDALTYRGNAVRQVDVSVTLADGVATVGRARAQFPGGSDVSVVGKASNVDGQARFDGTLEAASDDLRAVLAWLDLEVPSVPAGRLRKMSLQSTLRLTPELGQIFGIDLRLDSSRLTGGAAYAFRERPSFSVDFVVDRLNADAYRQEDAAQTASEDAAASSGEGAGNGDAVVAANNGAGDEDLAILNDFDANIRLAVGSLTFNETRVDGLLIDGTLLGGRFTLREASVSDLAGATASLTGAAGNFGRGPVFASNLEMSARDPGGLLRLLDVSLPVSSDRIGKTEVKGTLSGSMETIDLDVTARLGTTRAKIDGTLALDTAQYGVELSLGVVNDSFVDFASLLGFDIKPVGANRDGRLSLSGTINGALDNLSLDLKAAAADAEFTVAGSLADISDSLSFNLAVSAGHPDIAAFLASLGVAYRPAAANLGALRLDADIAGDADRIRLSSAEGRAGPVAFAGSADVNFDGVRPRIVANLEMSEVLVDLFLPRARAPQSRSAARGGTQAGGAANSAAPRATDTGRWSTEPLDLEVLRGFDADIKIAARGLIYGSYTFKEPKIALTLDDGTLSIDPLTGRLFDGDVTLKMKVVEGPILKVDAKVGLAAADIERALVEAAGIDRVTGRFDMTGEFATSGQSQRDMVSNLGGSLGFNAKDGILRGVDLLALSDRLNNLDRTLDFVALITASLGGGQTRYSTFQGNFAIEDGVARTNDLTALMEAAEGTGEGVIDLPNWRIDLRTRARLTEHPDTPAIGLDLVGPLDSPRRDAKTRDLEAYLAERVGANLIRRILPRERRTRDEEQPLDARSILRGILKSVGD